MSDPSQQLRVQHDGDDLLIAVKAVPGASCDQVAGLVGDRLKVRTPAAAEGGKANKAICALIAKRLGLRVRDVSLESGHASPEKVLRVRGSDERSVRELGS